MKTKNIKHEDIKQGCIYPFMIISITCAIAIIIILLCSLKGCKRGNYDYSPNTINTVEDQSQTDEMRSYHSDKGLTMVENGLMVIKK